VTRFPGPAPGACFADPRSPWSTSLAPPAPPRSAPLCSSASQLLRRSQTSRICASPASAPRLPGADLRRPSAGQIRDLPVPVQRASAHARVFDHAGADGARAIAPARVVFRVIKHVGLPIEDFSLLNSWPMRSPINASPTSSQLSPHDSGASVVGAPVTQHLPHRSHRAAFRQWALVEGQTQSKVRSWQPTYLQSVGSPPQ
jgi:hypothetical protein